MKRNFLHFISILLLIIFLSIYPIYAEFSISNFLQHEHLLTEYFGIKDFLDKIGISYDTQLITDTLGNVTGGNRKGISNISNIVLAANLDLKKLTNIQLGNIYYTMIYIYGYNPSNFIGDTAGVSNIAARNNIYFYELSYEKKFFNDRLSIRGGILPIDTEFFISETSTLFLNSSFGSPSILLLDLLNSGPTYPLSTPGIRIIAKPYDWCTIKADISEANPWTNINRNILYDSSNKVGGLLSFNEISFTWKSILRSNTLPGTIKFGCWLQSIPKSLPDFSSSSSLPYSSGFYGIIDQVLYHHDEGRFKRELSSFCRLSFSPQNYNPSSLYLDVGCVMYDPFIYDRRDKIGLAFFYANTSSGYQKLYAKNSASYPAEIGLELSYSYRLNASMIIQPDIQYIIHPNSSIVNNSLVLGFRCSVAL